MIKAQRRSSLSKDVINIFNRIFTNNLFSIKTYSTEEPLMTLTPYVHHKRCRQKQTTPSPLFRCNDVKRYTVHQKNR